MKSSAAACGAGFPVSGHQLFGVDVFSDVCFGPKNLGLPKEEIEKEARERGAGHGGTR